MQVYDTLRAGAILDVRVGTSIVVDPKAKEAHEANLAEIQADESLDAEAKAKAIDDDNTAYNAASNSQDIIHIGLNGGEKRSILRSNLAFSPIVAERPVDGFPVYAQKRPVVNAGIKPLEETQPSQPVLASDTVHDQGAAQPVPIIGDYLVEDFDPLTDKFVQKIYDAVTFNRYFKASLN